MTKYVIDTNVPIVANGCEAEIAIDCRLAAAKLLLKAIDEGIIYLDSNYVIQREYHRHLKPSGQPGVGDRFYLEVINSHPDRVDRVYLPTREDGQFQDLPQPVIDSKFDQSDRVFAALAKKMGTGVYNAVDSDWLFFRSVIEENGIPITFICGCDPALWRT